jgi:hypothetical protein
MDTLRKKILECLKSDKSTRDSDVRLTQVVWFRYYKEFLFVSPDERWSIRIGDLHKVPREDNIKRIRATIQNDEHLYLPESEEVRKQRRIKEDEWVAWLGYNK